MSSLSPPRCWAEIDLGGLRYNAEVARKRSGCEVLAVVKANAYGHGAVPVARALSEVASMFGVANVTEAEELRAGGIAKPILLLSACLAEDFLAALRQEFHVCVSTREDAAALDAMAGGLGVKAHAHAVVDTGMGRIGFPEALWHGETIRTLIAQPNIVWEGLASHLPSPDEDEAFTRDQLTRFAKCVDVARGAGLGPHWVHTVSGAGLLGYAEQGQTCNLARPGLMLYGVSPLPKDQSQLQTVMTWKTRIALVRELPAGHGISYGRTEILKRTTKVATLACGYADGYPRQVSGNGAQVLIHGRRCPILGRVTMDQIMADVTDLPTPARAGEEVVLVGAQGGEFISAAEVAQKAWTIAWHVFTGITARVERLWQ
jgi:alanine racemase